MKRYIPSALLSLFIMAGAVQASTYTFSLTQDGCSSPICGTGPYGSVTITDESGYVLVTETLTSGNDFPKTGAGDSLEFQLSSAATSITNLTSGFSTTTGTQSASAFGSFTNGISCSGCGSGNSNPLYGPISFDLNGVTTSDFIANSDGDYFASDIYSSSTGGTGNVAADSRTLVATPEPGTLSFLFLGSILVLAGLRRKTHLD
jgi:hypothetical protein